MRQRLAAGVALVAVLTAGSLARPAWAQMDSRDAIALQNQILELRRQVQILQEQVARGGGGGGGGGSFLGLGGGGREAPPPDEGGAAGDLLPQLVTRVQALEEEVRHLRGQMDDLQNASQRQYEDLNKQIGDLRFRLGQSAPGAAPAAPSVVTPATPPQAMAAIPSVPPSGFATPLPPPAPPPSLGPPPGTLGAMPATPAVPMPAAPSVAPAPSGPVPRTPERAIQEGEAALARHDYDGAEAAAREVLQNNRTSPRAYDAQFLMAQAMAGKRDYAQAAIAYDDTYNRSRNGAHAQDALLGLAASLSAIGEKRAACETLDKLAHEFPNGHADEVRNARSRYACS